MSTKLTLTLEKEVIEVAKVYAKEKGQSLSELVENYFKFLTENSRLETKSVLSKKVESLRGILDVNKTGLSYEQIQEEELMKKYGY
jgi:hypothetical protein